MAENLQFDFDLPGGRIKNCKTFSINIFQWVFKANRCGLKRTACKYRIKGDTSNSDAVLDRAYDVCKEMNDGIFVLPKKAEETVSCVK